MNRGDLLGPGCSEEAVELARWIDAAIADVATGYGEVELRLVVKAGSVVQRTKVVVVSEKAVDSVRHSR